MITGYYASGTTDWALEISARGHESSLTNRRQETKQSLKYGKSAMMKRRGHGLPKEHGDGMSGVETTSVR